MPNYKLVKETLIVASTDVRFVVDLTVNPGAFDAFDATAKKMTARCKGEPGTTGYEFFVSADRAQTRLVETYADARSALSHLTGPVVSELVPQLLESSSLQGFEVYGDPGPEATKILEGFGANSSRSGAARRLLSMPSKRSAAHGGGTSTSTGSKSSCLKRGG